MNGRKPFEDVISTAAALRWEVGGNFHDSLMEAVYTDAARIADRAVTRTDAQPRFDLDRAIDRLVTSRWFGFPTMLLMLTAIFWVTIEGANVPSSMLATLLIDTFHPVLKQASAGLALPWWLDGVLIDGMYLAMAWVVSVMLPPMAIFFPLFTLLEDFGYLPRVAFNLDNFFKKAGAHGKQALTMSMGFGMQRRGCRLHARDRQSKGTPDCHHHEQFRALQRTLANPDPRRDGLHRRIGPRTSGRTGVGRRRCGRGGPGRRPFVRRFVGAFTHGPEG